LLFSQYVVMREIVMIKRWFRNRWEARFHSRKGEVFLSCG